MIDATMFAAGLARSAKFGPPAAYQNLDSPVTAVSGRGMGFRGPQLTARVPRYAFVAIRNGVTFGHADRMARRQGWYLGERTSDGEVKKAAHAAHFESSLQMVASCINAS